MIKLAFYRSCDVSHETKNKEIMRAEKNKNVNIALELFNSYVNMLVGRYRIEL